MKNLIVIILLSLPFLTSCQNEVKPSEQPGWTTNTEHGVSYKFIERDSGIVLFVYDLSEGTYQHQVWNDVFIDKNVVWDVDIGGEFKKVNPLYYKTIWVGYFSDNLVLKTDGEFFEGPEEVKKIAESIKLKSNN